MNFTRSPAFGMAAALTLMASQSLRVVTEARKPEPEPQVREISPEEAEAAAKRERILAHIPTRQWRRAQERRQAKADAADKRN